MHEDVLNFWFEELEPKAWFTSDPAFDAVVRERFGALLEQAAAGELHAWRREARADWPRSSCSISSPATSTAAPPPPSPGTRWPWCWPRRRWPMARCRR